MVLGCYAAAASATDSPKPATPAPASDLYLEWWSGWSAASEVGGGDQMRIALDPETGQWGFAPVQQALEVSGIMAAPLVIHRADGSIAVFSDPRMVDYVFARIGPAGRPAFGCLPSDALRPGEPLPVTSTGAPDR
jgi:hypothetical protein